MESEPRPHNLAWDTNPNTPKPQFPSVTEAIAIHSLHTLQHRALLLLNSRTLQQRALLFLNHRLEHLQALHIASVLVDVLTLGQRSTSLVEVEVACCQVHQKILFLFGGAERDVRFHFVVRRKVGGLEEVRKSSHDGAGDSVAGAGLLVVGVSWVCELRWIGIGVRTSLNCWSKVAIASVMVDAMVVSEVVGCCCLVLLLSTVELLCWSRGSDILWRGVILVCFECLLVDLWLGGKI